LQNLMVNGHYINYHNRIEINWWHFEKVAQKGIFYTHTVRAYYGTSTSYYNTKGLAIKDKY